MIVETFDVVSHEENDGIAVEYLELASVEDAQPPQSYWGKGDANA